MRLTDGPVNPYLRVEETLTLFDTPSSIVILGTKALAHTFEEVCTHGLHDHR